MKSRCGSVSPRPYWRVLVGEAALLAFAGLVGCAPPPIGGDGPTIEILWPESGAEVALDEGCALTEILVVHVEGIEMVEPAGELVEGQGHWHGGPDLGEGYCFSAVPFCYGSATPEPFLEYDGGGLTPEQNLTLYAELQDNLHAPMDVLDQVEIRLVDPEGHCGATGT